MVWTRFRVSSTVIARASGSSSFSSSRRMSIRVTNRRLIRRMTYAMTATMRIDSADAASSRMALVMSLRLGMVEA